eukprot:Rhum_TRINITY_DN12580_c0_g1::Rhum_TRINITY_DN12580_c0_g1_i1::g.52548::m.52548
MLHRTCTAVSLSLSLAVSQRLSALTSSGAGPPPSRIASAPWSPRRDLRATLPPRLTPPSKWVLSYSCTSCGLPSAKGRRRTCRGPATVWLLAPCSTSTKASSAAPPACAAASLSASTSAASSLWASRSAASRSRTTALGAVGPCSPAAARRVPPPPPLRCRPPSRAHAGSACSSGSSCSPGWERSTATAPACCATTRWLRTLPLQPPPPLLLLLLRLHHPLRLRHRRRSRPQPPPPHLLLPQRLPPLRRRRLRRHRRPVLPHSQPPLLLPPRPSLRWTSSLRGNSAQTPSRFPCRRRRRPLNRAPWQPRKACV